MCTHTCMVFKLFFMEFFFNIECLPIDTAGLQLYIFNYFDGIQILPHWLWFLSVSSFIYLLLLMLLFSLLEVVEGVLVKLSKLEMCGKKGVSRPWNSIAS